MMRQPQGSDQGATQPSDTVQCPTCGRRLSKLLSKCPQDGTPLLVGSVGQFWERYEFLEPLGQGGMSVIYRARQRALNRVVAIKMMHEHMMNGQAVRRFQQEGQSASSLDHPNIVKVHDFGLTEQGQPYMVMDLVEGKSLSQVLDELGELPITQCLIIFIDICDALIHAHEKGILHRDLKPSNIMLTTTTERPMLAKLVDFGIAKVMDEDADSPVQKLTQTGELFGSPLYMSPEQCYGKKVDRRSDIYSFACLMFECLTGRVPFRGDTLVDTISKQMTAKPPLLSEVRPDKSFPRRLEDVIDKCLTKNPDGRYRTIDDVRTQLVSIQQEVDDGLQKEKSSMRQILRAAAEWRLTVILISVSALSLAGLTYGLTALRSGQAIAKRDLAMQKAQFLPIIMRDKITNEVITECLPENTGLKYLDLHDAVMGDPAMRYVGFQTELKELDLHNTSIGDDGVESLKDLHNLNKLNLAGTQIFSKSLSILRNMPQLIHLNLSRTRIDGRGAEVFRTLTHLQDLDLSDDNGLKGPCLNSLADLPLGFLNLSRCKQLKADDVSFLSKLPTLNALHLNGTTLDDSAIQYLTKLPALHELELRDTAFKDGCTKYLAKINTLRELDISDSKIGPAGITQIARSLDLHKLKARGLHTDNESMRNFKNFEHLTTLDLASCEDLDDDSVAELAKIKSLTHLNLSAKDNDSKKSKLTAKALTIIGSQMPQLKELKLNHTNVINVESVKELTKLTHLKELDIRGINLHDSKGDNDNQIMKTLKTLSGCHIENDW